MDKTEELKKQFIKDWKPSHHRAWTKYEYDNVVMKFEVQLGEYAQQVSREIGSLFWKWVHKNKSHDQRLRYSFDELWNQWKLNQNQQ